MKQKSALYLVSGVTLTLGLTGCPVTDDYFLLDARSGTSPAGGSGSTSGSGPASGSGAGAEGGTSAVAGTSASGGSGGVDATGGTESGLGGAPEAGAGAGAGDSGGGGAAGEPGTDVCVPSTERCNGRDDDCDELVDEFACLSSCWGFVLPLDPSHGYMFCTGPRRAGWDGARKACEDEDMRLAWIETAEENEALRRKLNDLTLDPEILFGATDQSLEGSWIWYGGDEFWSGDQHGAPVQGRFNAWDGTSPNNNKNEDCAVMLKSGAWNDRVCSGLYPFVCEQPE